ncbi:phosphatidate cytidylyltransferase [Phaeacidiphilus oryzae]|uniref:phosphatidate cytidylyltransferase n=1 Tax=Phaeacidiphilus oryzae TaxID=348818 RepID=UPI0009FC242A|nr:phosphatidate cytidylyltransferase [Phaeacidiphilus oryzae]
MPPVTDGPPPEPADDARTTRLAGPLFRDEAGDPAGHGGGDRSTAADLEATAQLPLVAPGAPGLSDAPSDLRRGAGTPGGYAAAVPQPEQSSPSQPPSGQPQTGRPQTGQPQTGQPSNGQQPKKAPRGGRNLPAAVGVGVGLGAVILASLFFVKSLFIVVVAAAVVVGVYELTSRLTERKGIRVPVVPVAVGGVAMQVAAYFKGAEGALLAFALTALAVLVWRMAEPPEEYLRDVTAGIFTAFYVPLLATFVILLLKADDGPERVVLFLLLTVCSDTGAYAVGALFGKHKLAPRISPGKTREGLVGGVGLAMIAGALGTQFMIDNGHWWQGLVLGACVAVSATLGDLGESMIKRDLGIKDMGTLLPGHGGLMDRLDSLLPSAPVVWLVLAGLIGTG